MVSNILMRHSLAAAKLPLVLFQFGTSASIHAPHSDLLLNVDTPLGTASHTYSTIDFAYVPGGHTSQFHFPLLQLHTDDDMAFGYSGPKCSVNNPTNFPPSKRSHESYYWTFERLLSLGLVPPRRRRLRDIRLAHDSSMDSSASA